jgi:hypothetical protein
MSDSPIKCAIAWSKLTLAEIFRSRTAKLGNRPGIERVHAPKNGIKAAYSLTFNGRQFLKILGRSDFTSDSIDLFRAAVRMVLDAQDKSRHRAEVQDLDAPVYFGANDNVSYHSPLRRRSERGQALFPKKAVGGAFRRPDLTALRATMVLTPP